MSTVTFINAQIGKSSIANQNFTWYQPIVPDGSVRLGRGNSGNTNLDLIKASNTDIEMLNPKAISTPLAGDNSKSLATTDFITPLLGNRNYIHNGSMIINQKNATEPLTTSFKAHPDRWWGVAPVNGYVVSSLETLIFKNVSKKTVRRTITSPMTVPINSVYVALLQHIEPLNCLGMNNCPLTLSFIFNANFSGTSSVVVRSAGPTGLWTDSDVKSVVKQFTHVANVPIKVIFNIPANLIGSFEYSNGMYGASVGICNLGNIPANHATTATGLWEDRNISSVQGDTNWLTTVGNFIEATEIQLEKGNYATAFEHRPYSYELALCQRYYEKIYLHGVMGTWSPSGNFFISQYLNFATTKRAAPTLFNINQSGNGYWTNWGTTTYSGSTPATGTQGWNGTSVSKNEYYIFQTRIPGNTTPVAGYAYTTEGAISLEASAEI